MDDKQARKKYKSMAKGAEIRNIAFANDARKNGLKVTLKTKGDTYNTITEEIQNYDDAKNQFNKTYWLGLFEKTNGNISEMSRLSKRYRADIYKILKNVTILKGALQ